MALPERESRPVEDGAAMDDLLGGGVGTSLEPAGATVTRIRPVGELLDHDLEIIGAYADFTTAKHAEIDARSMTAAHALLRLRRDPGRWEREAWEKRQSPAGVSNSDISLAWWVNHTLQAAGYPGITRGRVVQLLRAAKIAELIPGINPAIGERQLREMTWHLKNNRPNVPEVWAKITEATGTDNPTAKQIRKLSDEQRTEVMKGIGTGKPIGNIKPIAELMSEHDRQVKLTGDAMLTIDQAWRRGALPALLGRMIAAGMLPADTIEALPPPPTLAARPDRPHKHWCACLDCERTGRRQTSVVKR
jgi:hypothetical protein